MALRKLRAGGDSTKASVHGLGWRRRVGRPLKPSAALVTKVAAGLMLGLVARAFLPDVPSEASHQSDPLQYLKSMKTSEVEDVCTQVFNLIGSPAIDQDVAIARVNDTLFPSGWDGVGTGRIAFHTQDASCEHPTEFEFFEISYYVMPVTDCPGDVTGAASCAIRIGQYGLTEYDAYDVEIYTPMLIDPALYQFVINHETGHVFGIAHNPENLSSCPGDSIMHYLPPCPNPPTNASTYPWPTSEDKASVENIMGPLNYGGGHIGGGCGRGISSGC